MNSVTVTLHGGPVDLPETVRTQQIDPTQAKIKVRHQGGYEHFERRSATPSTAPSIEDAAAVPFHWTMRTRIAE